MSDKCNFNAFVDRNISNKNKTIEIIIDTQHVANIILANKTVSRYRHNTVTILNKKPKPAAPIEYFK